MLTYSNILLKKVTINSKFMKLNCYSDFIIDEYIPPIP